MSEVKKYLYEILVPANDNYGEEIPIDKHRIWDGLVREVAGGLTIMGEAKGQWTSLSGQIFYDIMIPVRVVCTEEQIKQIARLTLCYYDQEAVLHYRISEEVIFTYREEPQADGFKE